ncbi:histidine kinase [Luteipulveratus mongoliensis]|uniref:histidine kinase n=1 Tax=Luteipulveratus mongoliensis TaxID=571913 RepID=A0A0K1JRP0_9MICO|nr:histidine kinase [Luteipulveratus mongoliensis]
MPRPALLDEARRVVRRALVSLKWLLAGTGTALLAFGVLALVVLVALLCLIGVGLLLIGPTLSVVRPVAQLERRRLRAIGHPVDMTYDRLPRGAMAVWRYVRTDETTRRDLWWLGAHATVGLVVGLFAIQLPLSAVQGITIPVWWQAVSADDATVLNGFVHISSWPGAWMALVIGLVWLVLTVALPPVLLRAQTAAGRRWLPPHPDLDLSERVAQLTATRAAALDAHAVELRRIERALHDGAQNRLVTVAVLTGAARQAMARDPAEAEAILERAQTSAETALAELRSVVRSILPPVLERSGLPGAVSALAAQCPVPTRATVDVSQRCPAAVEASAYFAVAEGLTNVARHSKADRATVLVERRGSVLVVRIEDDGVGGAVLQQDSGLSGIQRRAEAHDGTLRVSSPVGGPTVVEVSLPCGS